MLIPGQATVTEHSSPKASDKDYIKQIVLEKRGRTTEEITQQNHRLGA